MNKQKTFK